jgi:hypothetical protein
LIHLDSQGFVFASHKLIQQTLFLYFLGQLFKECQKLLSHRMPIVIDYDDPDLVRKDERRFVVGLVIAQSKDYDITEGAA